MNIADKKEEILKLIERLNPDSAKPASRQRGGAAILQHPLSRQLARRRQELVALRAKREKIGLDLLEERMLKTCQMLEERIARIERIIGLVAAEPGQPEPSPLPAGMKPARPAATTEPAPQAQTPPVLDSDLPDVAGIVLASEQVGQEPAQARPAAGKDRIYSLSGVIQEGVLADILQLLTTNKKTGAFTTDGDGTVVEMYFREGHLYHARSESLVGQSAFFAAMAMENGTFFFDETDALPDEATIDGNTQFLILEALRQIDEERAGT